MEAKKNNASGGEALTKSQFDRIAEKELTELKTEIQETKKQIQALRAFFAQLRGAATN